MHMRGNQTNPTVDRFFAMTDIRKSFPLGDESLEVLHGITMTLGKGEYLSVLAPSGSGKSTIMNIIGCLDTATSGDYMLNGQRIEDMDEEELAWIRNREIGFIFQNSQLLPKLDALRNVELPLIYAGVPGRERTRRATELLERVGLSDRMHHYPGQLSGGQQQRVAIARTLAPEPTVLFMDEPLSNLDAKLRLEMRYELQRLHVETGSTFVYVTHDQMEAMTLATQICLINNGVLQQYEAPLKVYARPNNLFVADFVGNPSINFIEAKGAQEADGAIALSFLGGLKAKFLSAEGVELKKWFADRDAAAEAAAAALREAAKEKGYVEKGNKDETFKYHIAKVNEEDDALAEEPVLTNEDFVLGVRPEFIEIDPNGAIEGEIYGAMPTGMESTIKVRVGEFLLTGVVFGSTLFKIGEKIRFNIDGDKIMLFDRKGGKCISLGSLKF